MQLPDLSPYVSRAIVFLVAMTVHEFAHAYVAHLNGDDTAKMMGRMTLDPRANINPIGYLMGVLIGFGFLGSAPVVAARMRNPRWGMFQAVLAGPLSNLLIAALFAMPVRFGLIPHDLLVADSINNIIPSVGQLLWDMVSLNVLLFVFNLLPLFPLDGWTVVFAALPAAPAVWWQRYQQITMYIFYGLIILSFLTANQNPNQSLLAQYNPLNWLVWQPTDQITYALFGS